MQNAVTITNKKVMGLKLAYKLARKMQFIIKVTSKIVEVKMIHIMCIIF